MILDRIRAPKSKKSLKKRILIIIVILICGAILGVVQKIIDGKEPFSVFSLSLDIANYFGRLPFWVLSATMISVFAPSPLQASIRTFVYFIGMLSGYYLYCNFVSGFLPVSYMMIWVTLSVVSFFLAFVCWYAKGKDIVAIIISSIILGVLFSEAFVITQGFYVRDLLCVITWIIGVIVLYRKPKEFAVEIILSIVVAFLVEYFSFWSLIGIPV